MRPLVRDEIAPLGPYAAVRDAYRRAVIAHKGARRLGVGPNVTLLFEDRETLRFQVQEMLWVERIGEPARVQHELDVYNELMPREGELSATLFVEITEPGRIRAELDRLVGIDEHVALALGEGDGARVVPARFDDKQFEEDRISAVQYIRFPLDAQAAAALADAATRAAVRITHPVYRHEAELPPGLRASLVAGLSREPASLLPPLPEPGAAAGPDVLLETAAARVLRPRSPAAPGHLEVEARAPCDPELDPATWSAVLEVVRGVAREAVARGGSCRIVADLTPGEPPRWQILPKAR